jgi:hypothetical protein
MEISETDVSDARIVALEKKVRDMEALGTGLINELLDLKSNVITMSKEADEYSRQELKRGTVVRGTASPGHAEQTASVTASPDGNTVVRPRSTRQPDAPSVPAEPAMVLIMQTDGTMKMEPRCGDRSQTDSSGGYEPTRRVNLSRATRTR